MKRITVLTLFLVSIAGLASAQTSTSNKSSNTKHVASTYHHSKKTPGKKSTAAKTIETDNRKEYVKDGQLATHTGHDATPVNSDQYQSPRDSSNKKRKKQ